MALTQGARNKIKSFVQAAKRLLMADFTSQLQEFYGIRPDGTTLMVEQLTSKEGAIIQTARLLRERKDYLANSIAGEHIEQEAVEQLVREQAFTILNRFAALRMAEERNIVRESIRKGYESEGFSVYDQLTGGAKTAEQFQRYSWYIKAVFDELSIDLPSVFSRYSPYALLFPTERVLLELLAIIDDEALCIYREEGQQPINLWKEDETIGWIFQYYNSREEISAMRDASGAPRNSRELAVRNQFFTPRYVVQFLVDNSLGRQWYEMTTGRTELVNQCQYMVKRPKEFFLAKGKLAPEIKEENVHYIEYRALKDPREILMLDPACGSMHFGLYCFDIFEQIYLEAWDHFPELMPDLREKYLRDDFVKQIPEMIIRYNIHGVDIAPRAIQIAGLSLWMRAQKSYDKLGLEPKDRPRISKSNLVVAEPMPGDAKLLSQFTQTLPGPIGKLVSVIWDKMKLAGETGLLLKIEEELKKEIEVTQKEWKRYKNGSPQTTLWSTSEDIKLAEKAAIYGDKNITEDFFHTAEEQVLNALKSFAENADGEDSFQRLLFAEDTTRGFAFIELCRKRYDVIVMNPPFGAGSISTENYYKSNYPDWGKNILCCFFSRMAEIAQINGNISAIFDRTVSVKSSYEKFRRNLLLGKIEYAADTGWGVLDANVETCAYVLSKNICEINALFFDLRESKDKSKYLSEMIIENKGVRRNSSNFQNLPNAIIGYFVKKSIIKLFGSFKNIRQVGLQARDGHTLDSFQHNRVYWEVKENSDKFSLMYNGGKYSLFYYPYRDLCMYGKDGRLIKENKRTILRNLAYHHEPGIGYGKRGDYFDAHILKKGVVFTKEGQAINQISTDNSKLLISFLNSSLVQYILSLYAGQHKASGYLNLLPLPSHNTFPKISLLIDLKRESFIIDETCLETNLLISELAGIDLKQALMQYVLKIEAKNIEYKNLVNENDIFWLEQCEIPEDLSEEISNFSRNRPKENLYSLESELTSDSKFHNFIASEIIQNLVGVVFGRWDLKTNTGIKDRSDSTTIFDKLDLLPNILLKKNKVSDFNDGIAFLSQELLIKKLSDYVSYCWPKPNSVNELEQFLEGSLEDFFEATNGFFDFHLMRYTKSRRVAPIYWQLSTISNSYTVWVYYPKLNENTLFQIVNDLVEPKIDEIQKEISVLELGDTTKELNDKKEFRDELEDFKNELLKVAQLPYKPNQDDGVLITAAPLYHLFRHTRWRRSTEDCWKKLEKGEYDWSHLSYGIWPKRVREKCKKDLSLAIAHGLEQICEVKPKETKKRVKKGVKIETQIKMDAK